MHIDNWRPRIYAALYIVCAVIGYALFGWTGVFAGIGLAMLLTLVSLIRQLRNL